MERASLGDQWAFGRPHQPFVTPRKRRWSGVAAITALFLMLSGALAVADVIDADGDEVASGANPMNLGTICIGTSGSDSASVYVRATGHPGTGTNNFANGSTVAFAVTSTSVASGSPAGSSIGATVPASPGNEITLDSNWIDQSNGSLSDAITSTITVTAGSATGSFSGTVNYQATGTRSTDASPLTRNGSLSVTATISNTGACSPAPANTAPSVAFNTGTATSADEGTATTFNYTITDPDANTWTTVAGFPSCGAGNTVSNATLVGKSGSFQCTFVDGVVPAQSVVVSVQVSDGTANSNVATTSVTVNNVNPTVVVPAFTASAVDCRVEVTLGTISFTDPGVNDGGTNGWAVAINWGDGSTDTTFNANSQGAQSNQTHTYDTPGTYNATVTVTDKDGGAGSNTTSAALTVTQEYTVSFLQPFDQSTLTKYVINKAKAGRTVPVKVQIYDVCAQVAYVSPSSAPRIAVNTASASGATSDSIEAYADAGTSNDGDKYLRWSVDGFWIYNLDTRTVLNGGPLVSGHTYRIDVWVTELSGTKATDDEFALLQSVK